MKKLLIILVTIFLCGCVAFKARDAVINYLDKYINNDAAILEKLDELVQKEKMNELSSVKYKEVMKRQYRDLKYEILEEEYNGDEAMVKTNINVYNYLFAQKNALEYKESHKNEFLDENNVYDSKKFLDYKLDEMQKTNERIDYVIDFKVVKKDNKWILENISTDVLEKIHGIYKED